MPSPLPRRNRWVFKSFSFPNGGGLLHIPGGSASALPFSRPAQRSLLVTACTLAESLTDPFTSEASAASLPPPPFRLLPAGTTLAGWDLHPLRPRTFARHTEIFGLASCPLATWGAYGVSRAGVQCGTFRSPVEINATGIWQRGLRGGLRWRLRNPRRAQSAIVIATGLYTGGFWVGVGVAGIRFAVSGGVEPRGQWVDAKVARATRRAHARIRPCKCGTGRPSPRTCPSVPGRPNGRPLRPYRLRSDHRLRGALQRPPGWTLPKAQFRELKQTRPPPRARFAAGATRRRRFQSSCRRR